MYIIFIKQSIDFFFTGILYNILFDIQKLDAFKDIQGQSYISVPLAVNTALMASSLNSMLGNGLQGGCRGPQEPMKPHPSTSIAGILPALEWGKKKDRALQIMSFMVQWPYRGPLLHGLEKMGKLIVTLKQISITPLDALTSVARLRHLERGGARTGKNMNVNSETEKQQSWMKITYLPYAGKKESQHIWVMLRQCSYCLIIQP